MECDIRYSQFEDEPYLVDWLMDAKNQKWLPPSTKEEALLFARCWIAFSRYKASLTATVNGVPGGAAVLFLMPYRKVAHHALIYFLAKEDLEEDLLKNSINLGKNYFFLEHLIAEVFEGYPFSSLLEKYGFKRIAKQKYFVKEDGTFRARILYQKFLGSK